jgi:hypothetical protein
MLNLMKQLTIFKLMHALILIALFSLYSCTPTSSTSKLDANKSTAKPGTPTATVYPEPEFPIATTFVQESDIKSSTNFSLPADFSDSFLVRGKSLSQYLRTLPTTTKFCMVGKYTFTPGTDKFLILAAKPKSYTDLAKKTTEFYLQVEPSNDVANQNDCLSYNLTDTLFEGARSPQVFFSFNQICANCTTTVTSSGLKLYFVNGEETPTINVSSLIMTISGNSTSYNNGNCTESTACKARGFDCCLASQCVNDGAVKPGTMTLPGFAAAQEDVKLNPSRFVVYPQFYFVCESRPDTEGNDDSDTVIDPDYEAGIRIMELKQLYDCINKVEGEFSLCTLKFTGASEIIKTSGEFSAGDSNYFDDVNFTNLNPNLKTGNYINNIFKIVYAGQTLYVQDQTTPFVDGTIGVSNDDLSTAQKVKITAALPPNAQDDNLYITYKVDGTCEKVGSTLAKCTKTYIQQYSDTKSTMWHDNSKTFLLPEYADTSVNASIILKIGGVVIPEDDATWSKVATPNKIVFANSYAIYQNQTIEITYFVKSTYASKLVNLKNAAQERVNTMCTCTSTAKCNLKPIMDPDNTAVVNYECSYATATSNEPPANQTVYVSNKNVAHRYFDSNGVSYDDEYGDALPQEGTEFNYTSNNALRPNNVSKYIGFNEIYGSFIKNGTYIARPAKIVRVKKDKYYDILTTAGVFSGCITCGADYYSAFQKIFPQNFSGQGGGYAPDNYESRRETNTSLYRPDDLLYGRACFVPATMIPWTHVSNALNSSIQTPRDQRISRLAGQHFLFANGYNRDWFGFDYGSMIGSFDGVTWFSIGNQRRIKATTGKLYLAVNAYAGDLSLDSNFNVTVSETTTFSSPIPDHDSETDGSQCQRSHYCSNDNDCFRQLGYDYTCQNVTSINTNWPLFDSNAAEILGSTLRSLSSVVGGTNGQAKRCIYRGRGAPCLKTLSQANTGNNFSGSTVVGTVMCSPNTSCLDITTSNKFNDRISRFANTPATQNAAVAAGIGNDSDTVGLGARILLRPFDYYGKASMRSEAQTSFTANKISAICVPGKNVASATTNLNLNTSFPSNRVDSSDKLFGVGPTTSSTNSIKALNACPATDDAGTTMQIFDLPLGDALLNRFTIAQNLSSNLLDLQLLRDQNIYSSTNASPITSVGYQRNACLRAPGASCFTDMECAPSTFIANRAKAAGLSAVLNIAESKYWEEELVCGNPEPRTLSGNVQNPEFDIKKNSCCREIGKTISVYTQTDASSYKWCDNSGNVLVAGVNTPISSTTRYSRVHSGYDKMTCNLSEMPTKSFALSIASSNPTNRMAQILAQFKTLDTINQRTCCTQHWVRSFATENGGGHEFDRNKMQNIDKGIFRNISWEPDDESTIVPAVGDEDFHCDVSQYLNQSCEIKSLTPADEEKYLTWAGSLELVGIPQVAIQSNELIYKLVNDSQNAISAGEPLTDTNGKKILRKVGEVGADFKDSTGTYYSASSYGKLNMELSSKNSMKKVFSENEFNCCIPTNQELSDKTTASQCCTGFIANVNGPKRCCLPDFTDLTVYLNRYVSSEGRGLPDSAYDPKTGYIKDPGQVQAMAVQKNLCCSGKVMIGVAVNQLSIPLNGGLIRPPDTNTTTRRFNYRTDNVDNNAETGSVGSIFDAGVRWNNHVYCVPEGLGK